MKNTKVENLLNSMFRSEDRIGGGLVEVLKREISSGKLLGGKNHITKAQQIIDSIEILQKTESLNKVEQEGIQKISNILEKLLGNIKK